MDEPTTNTGVEETTSPVEQVVEQQNEQQEAEVTQEPSESAAQDEPQTTTQEESSSTYDDDLDTWAVRAGRIAEGHEMTELERKLLQEQRNNQREFTKSRQEETQDKPTVEEQKFTDVTDNLLQQRNQEISETHAEDPVMQRVERMEAEMAKREIDAQAERFFDRNPDAAAIKNEVIVKAANDPYLLQIIASGGSEQALRHAYNDLMAAGRDQREATLKAEGKTEGLRDLQTKQRAAAVQGDATVKTTDSTELSAANAGAWWTGLTESQRRDPENRAKLDAAMKS